MADVRVQFYVDMSYMPLHFFAFFYAVFSLCIKIF